MYEGFFHLKMAKAATGQNVVYTKSCCKFKKYNLLKF